MQLNSNVSPRLKHPIEIICRSNRTILKLIGRLSKFHFQEITSTPACQHSKVIFHHCFISYCSEKCTPQQVHYCARVNTSWFGFQIVKLWLSSSGTWVSRLLCMLLCPQACDWYLLPVVGVSIKFSHLTDIILSKCVEISLC